jgi:hypothetical protein
VQRKPLSCAISRACSAKKLRRFLVRRQIDPVPRAQVGFGSSQRHVDTALRRFDIGDSTGNFFDYSFGKRVFIGL